MCPSAFGGDLTSEHEEIIDTVLREWMDYGLSTVAVDKDRAEWAVRHAYGAAGLDVPSLVIWADSPMECLSTVTAFDRLPPANPSWERSVEVRRSGLGDDLRVSSRSQVKEELKDRLKDQMHDRLRARLGDQLWDRLRSRLKERLWEQLWRQLRAQLGGQLLGRLWEQFRSETCTYVWGILDIWREAYWIALYTCAFRIAGLEPGERLETLAEASRHLGWWIPLNGTVVLSERPVAILRDDDHRLHCETGPALSWPDGYALHAWHGIRVPEWVITDPTPEAILAEGNEEIRRCAIESLGWYRYVAAAGLKLVAEAADPGDPGRTLSLYDVPTQVFGEHVRVLLSANGGNERDGAPGKSGLIVPVETATPLDAVDWSRGLTADRYRPPYRA
ncbi:DUF6745 domain-containing protein [Streptosporangium sp. NPDC001681]|uniref:DUF6745 domain-containing protein n=1 Tax=Streptosporangium sp. NPDC001681 TaxID=3154395 RepID=UPI0033320EB1